MKQKFLKKQKGMSLLEVIVSMLICGIGLAGMIAAIQASQRLASSAEYRAVATREIQSAVDMMRANRLGADAYITGTKAFGGTQSTSNGTGVKDAGEAICVDRTVDDGENGKRDVSPPTPRSICLNAMDQAKLIAEEEVARWQSRINSSLPSGKGTISAIEKAGVYIFSIKITWDINNENKSGPNSLTNPIQDSIQMNFAL